MLVSTHHGKVSKTKYNIDSFDLKMQNRNFDIYLPDNMDLPILNQPAITEIPEMPCAPSNTNTRLKTNEDAI